MLKIYSNKSLRIIFVVCLAFCAFCVARAEAKAVDYCKINKKTAVYLKEIPPKADKLIKAEYVGGKMLNAEVMPVTEIKVGELNFITALKPDTEYKYYLWSREMVPCDNVLCVNINSPDKYIDAEDEEYTPNY